MDISPILYNDYEHLYNTLFKRIGLHETEIYCICPKNDLFYNFLLKKNATLYHFDPDDTSSDIKYIVNCKHVYVTDPNTLSLLLKNNHFDLLLFDFRKFDQLTLPSNKIALPLSHNLGIAFRPSTKANSPRINFLPLVEKPYNFNSSMVALDTTTLNPSLQLKEGSELLYSIRSALTKFTESDLLFVYNNIPHTISRCTEYQRTCREDLRFFVWKNNLYGSYTYIDPYIAGKPTFNKLMVGRFQISKDGFTLEEEIIPKFGGNLQDNNRIEKNWTWWESPSGNLHCAYMFSPLKILSFKTLQDEPTEITHEDDKQHLLYNYQGTIRGGSSGVVYDNKVWCFTHTCAQDDKDTFSLGVVVLSHEEVPRILGYNHAVLDNKDYKTLLFYVTGAEIDTTTNTWILTGGIQDARCFVTGIPHNQLCSKINWI